MSRLTSKKLISFINSEFERLNMPEYEACEVIRTRYRLDDYEASACKLIIRVKDKRFEDNELFRNSFNCYYSLQQYEQYIKDGYKMYLKSKDAFGILRNMEVEVTKQIL